MPQRKAALKDLRQNRKRNLQNQDIKTELKKTVKKFKASVAEKNAKEAASDLDAVYKKLDKATKRNVLHKNTASRRKSQFSKLLAGIKQ